jgi:hypothetical protein
LMIMCFRQCADDINLLGENINTAQVARTLLCAGSEACLHIGGKHCVPSCLDRRMQDVIVISRCHSEMWQGNILATTKANRYYIYD